MTVVEHVVLAKVPGVIEITGVPYGPSIDVHCLVFKWNRECYQLFLEIWDRVLSELRKKGYKKVFAVIPENNDKLLKFASLFGMAPDLDGMLEHEHKQYFRVGLEL